MKKLLVLTLAVAMVTLSGSAFAQGKVWDDLSWWGQSGATPAPVRDCVRSGYWWWPLEPKSNANDEELWGNRGVVYANYTEKAPEPAKVTPPPPKETPKQAVKRTTPVFNHVLFDFDKSVLKPEGKAETDKVIAGLKEHAKDTLLIEGHTCNIGTPEYNMGLGQRRADSVKKYMVEQGIPEARISTKSFGLTQPAVPNDSPEHRKLNRRAVFDITVVD
ncbi:MAG: OmpA family protein [Candidatus Hydrogenedentes bacterium]|nr:OmpA family protein [Candidatus Hydrogenedentota bacterium]